MSDLTYLPGFANHSATEAVPGALPIGRNSPQHVPFGLYAEQLSGTAFTAPRAENRRTWLYRLRPTANHPAFTRYEGAPNLKSAPFDEVPPSPNRLRWDPLPMPATPTDWLRRPRQLRRHGQRRRADRRRHPPLRRHRRHGSRLLLCRRRAADRRRTGAPVDRHRARPDRRRAAPDRPDPARAPLPCHAARRHRPRVRRRELRRAVPPPRSGSDRRQRLGQLPRFRDAGRLVRGRRRALPGRAEVPGRAVGHDARPLAVRRRRLARQPRALPLRPYPLQHDQHRVASTIPTRRSSPCSPARATRPAPRIATS